MPALVEEEKRDAEGALNTQPTWQFYGTKRIAEIKEEKEEDTGK